jgi:hypothetical protein
MALHVFLAVSAVVSALWYAGVFGFTRRHLTALVRVSERGEGGLCYPDPTSCGVLPV